jgi:hypothetical protein
MIECIDLLAAVVAAFTIGFMAGMDYRDFSRGKRER